MFDELTIEANEESFVIVLQWWQWRNMNTLYSGSNFICQPINQETAEVGKTYIAVTSIRAWNSIPLYVRHSETRTVFWNSLTKITRDKQLELDRFQIFDI